MRKKVLFVATVDQHILSFHTPYLKWFRDRGFEVHVASNGDSEIPHVDYKYNLPFSRSPYKLKNLIVLRQLKNIIDKEGFDIIHCHTPMGGVLARIAALKARKLGAKVIYTAHGFHFYTGAPFINWLLFYPIEKWLAKYTDTLVTINEEDYNLAKKRSFRASKIVKVNGVGVNKNKYHSYDISEIDNLRKSLNLSHDDFILFFAAELSYRKNQGMLFEVMRILRNRIPNIRLLLAGTGSYEEEYMINVMESDLRDNVLFLGYRRDVNALINVSDIVVSSSRQEGLPVNILEAMAIGKACIVTDVRGNNDLIKDGENGYLCPIDNPEYMAKKIEILYNNRELMLKMGYDSLNKFNLYSEDKIKYEMQQVYSLSLSE